MSAPIYLHHPSSLDHDTGAHPERAQRIVAIERELAPRDWLGVERAQSTALAPERLCAVHSERHVRAIRSLCERGGGMIDLDTVASEGSWAAALHSAGGAIELVDRLMSGARTGFSVHRPPGHHAGRSRAMGFCLFNNIALAARHALDAHDAERVMIVDWDVHHGNGTSAVFHESPEVLFVSIHQYLLYPGTGEAGDRGRGPGEGYTVNLPVPGGSGDELWCSLVEHVAAELGRAYEPRLILVSAGYDAHADDPLGGCLVSDAGYATMAASLVRLAAELGVGLGMVLEGGYDLGALARSVAATVAALAAGPGPAPDLRVDPQARRAAAGLAERWPALASLRG